MIQNTPLVALPTKYGGITYRSRREARWALFLDVLGVRFEYEPEGFDLDGVWYLPDFFIPDQHIFRGGFWLEVKGPVPNKEEKEKLGLLVARSGIRGCIVNEIPCTENYEGWDCFFPPNLEARKRWKEDPDWPSLSGTKEWLESAWDSDNPYYFCKCSECGRIGFEFSGWVDRACFHGRKQNGDDHPAIIYAYSMARTERFGT